MTEVIVTLQADNFNRDYALPANVKLKELYPRLLYVLCETARARFGNLRTFALGNENGIFLDPEATLQDYGICTGQYLFVIEGGASDGR